MLIFKDGTFYTKRERIQKRFVKIVHSSYSISVPSCFLFLLQNTQFKALTHDYARTHTHTYKHTCTRLYKELLCSFVCYTHAHHTPTHKHSRKTNCAAITESRMQRPRRTYCWPLLSRSNISVALLHVCVDVSVCLQLFQCVISKTK